jgi:hypothetical protein
MVYRLNLAVPSHRRSKFEGVVSTFAHWLPVIDDYLSSAQSHMLSASLEVHLYNYWPASA